MEQISELAGIYYNYKLFLDKNGNDVHAARIVYEDAKHIKVFIIHVIDKNNEVILPEKIPSYLYKQKIFPYLMILSEDGRIVL